MIQFEDFNKIIVSNEFKDSEEEFKKELIASFIVELTVNEIRKSINQNLMNTLTKSFKKNLNQAFKNVR